MNGFFEGVGISYLISSIPFERYWMVNGWAFTYDSMVL